MQAGASAHICDFKAKKEPLDVTTKERVRELIGSFIAGGRAQRRANAKSISEYEAEAPSLSLENEHEDF